MPKVQVTAVVGHSTHDYDGTQVWHEAGTSYDVDAADVENLEAIGFARLSKVGPDLFQSLPKAADDHTATTTGPSHAAPELPPPTKSKRK